MTDDFVGVGGDLSPDTLLRAYRIGLFPMPVGAGQHSALGWWSPDPRGILPLDGLRVSRSLRRSGRRYDVTVDHAFEQVVAGCADPSRDGSWISAEIAGAYTELHRLGHAHSVETWLDDTLVGGLYGVAIGGLFAGESMFSRARDASKVALVHLVDVLSDVHAQRRVLDTQWQTPHLATLGVVEIDREEYLRRLEVALTLPLPAAFASRGSRPHR